MFRSVNPLNAEFNPICHLLTLLGAHHILHLIRIRVNVAVYCKSHMKQILYTLWAKYRIIKGYKKVVHIITSRLIYNVYELQYA